MHHPFFTEWYSRERHDDRLRESEAVAVVIQATRDDGRRSRAPRRVPIRIRLERPSDAAALDRLARSARRSPPRGIVVVAEDAGRVVAAVELHREIELVDPRFDRPEVVDPVRVRARQLAGRRAA